jgi:hypothetical protein
MQNSPSPLAKALDSTARDVVDFLNQISADDYTKRLSILSSSTIGQHTRHLIEFFVCIHRQYHQKEPCIDYSARKRDIQIESDPMHARDVLDKTISSILSDEQSWSTTIMSRHDSDFPEDRVPSSYGREVLYAIEHCIHHLAIIKIGILSENIPVELPENFGVAPSTVKYRENTCAQ